MKTWENHEQSCDERGCEQRKEKRNSHRKDLSPLEGNSQGEKMASSEEAERRKVEEEEEKKKKRELQKKDALEKAQRDHHKHVYDED